MGMRGWAGGMLRRMKEYPPQQPPYGAAQSLGRRAGARTSRRARVGRKPYRRTGTLGRGWRPTKLGVAEGGAMVSEVANAVPYTVFVQGDPNGPQGARQTEVMQSKGWQNIVAEGREEAAIWKPLLIRIATQVDVPKRPL